MINHSRPTISEKDILTVCQKLKQNLLGSGKTTDNFKYKLKSYFNCKKILLTSSGTSAIAKALSLIDNIGEGEVIIPAFVCDKVAQAVLCVKAKAVVIDINSDDFNISYDQTLKAITPKTKAIILPHMFGNPIRDIDKFKKIGIPIIEDIAQSFGGLLNAQKLGTFGDMSICSFYATKMITTGEGGALIINNKKYLEKKTIVDFYKMSDFQSALGISQLEKLDSFIKIRRQLANKYIDSFENIPCITIPEFDNKSVFYRFVMQLNKKINLDKLIKDFHAQNVSVMRFTDIVLNYFKINKKAYPNSFQALERIISIPIYPSLNSLQSDFVIKTVKKTLNNYDR